MQIKWQRWLWLPAGILAGVWMASARQPYFDPITGGGILGNWIWIFFNACLIGVAVFLLFKKWWRIVSLFLFFFFLLTSYPMPSKAGLKLHLLNETDSAIMIGVKRTEQPSRRLDFELRPHGDTVYRTAPGDYSESVGLTITVVSNELNVSIGELRTNLIIYTRAGLQLRSASNNPP